MIVKRSSTPNNPRHLLSTPLPYVGPGSTSPLLSRAISSPLPSPMLDLGPPLLSSPAPQRMDVAQFLLDTLRGLQQRDAGTFAALQAGLSAEDAQMLQEIVAEQQEKLRVAL
jgi:hypothetical protein